MRLDGEARAGCGRDRRAHDDVVREHEVGRQQAAQHSGVRLDVPVALGGGAVLHASGVEAFVAVEDEDGQQPVGELGPHARAPPRSNPPGAAPADHGDVVRGPRPFPHERPRVDVRARAAEEVAVPDADPHGRDARGVGS